MKQIVSLWDEHSRPGSVPPTVLYASVANQTGQWIDGPAFRIVYTMTCMHLLGVLLSALPKLALF